MRWTLRFPTQPNAFMGWVDALHRHHDHGGDAPGGTARFDRVVICDQCNAADGRARLQLGLPRDFSFSPAEIGQFIRGTPHGPMPSTWSVPARFTDAPEAFAALLGTTPQLVEDQRRTPSDNAE
ncbi:MAG: hypothetical protein M3Y70_03330 [Pseudomonadota bacterium]|nr:hypothetical protein [Pseudomonadota bacterium]